jgi:hypothetical protein
MEVGCEVETHFIDMSMIQSVSCRGWCRDVQYWAGLPAVEWVSYIRSALFAHLGLELEARKGCCCCNC